MRTKYILALLVIIFNAVPTFAARYSSSGEAFFCGALQGVLILIIILIYRAVKNNKKKDDNE